MRLFFYLNLLLLVSNSLFAQNQVVIDSLLNKTKSNISDKETVDIYVKIAKEYFLSDSLNTVKYANQAIELAEKIKYSEGKIDASLQIGRNILRLGYYDKGQQLFEQIIEESNQTNYQKGKADGLNGLGVLSRYKGNYEQALEYYFQALKILEELKDKLGISNIYNNIGIIYHMKGDYKKVLSYYLKALEIREELGNKRDILISYNNIGVLYRNQGNYRKALEYYLKALEINKELGDRDRIAKSYNNIGVIYKDIGNDEQALEYYFKALDIEEELGNKRGIATVYNNISLLYKDSDEYEKALNFTFKALKIREHLGDKAGIASCYWVMGTIYEGLDEDEKAIEYISKSIEIYEEIGAMADISDGLLIQGKIYRKQKKWDLAQTCLYRGLLISQEIKLIENIRDIAEELALVEEAKGDFQAAYHYHKLFKQMADSLKNEEQAKAIVRLEAEYEFQQEKDSLKFVNETERIALEKNIAKRKTKQRTTSITLGFSLLSIIILAFFFRVQRKSNQELSHKNEELTHYNGELKTSTEFIFEANQKNKKIKERLEEVNQVLLKEQEKNKINNRKLEVNNTIILKAHAKNKKMNVELKETLELISQQNEELKTSAELISEANQKNKKINKQLEASNQVILKAHVKNKKINTELKETLGLVNQQNEEILDSIQYAQRIQNSILPRPEYCQTLLPEHFIFFNPRDTVSGDFYFLDKVDNKVILAAVDCTGHGVPGAFMSLIGNNILNNITKGKQISQADKILNHLNQDILQALHQKQTQTNDGMDIALVSIDFETQKLEFAGAKNPLIYIQNNELKVIKGNKISIGGEQTEEERVFNSHQIDVSQPTTFYLFSDGYQDQFGGENGRKFMTKRFRELLLDIHQKPMQEQKQILQSTLTTWMGKEEQVDDILVMGVKV